MSTSNTESLFVTASRKKYRFNSNRGQLSTDDLWDLNLTSLDAIAIALDEEVQKAGKKSFVTKRTTSNVELEAKLEIVKFIISTKQEEAEARETAAAKRSQKEFLNSLLEKKKLEKLEGLTEEEIQKQLAELG